jgi:cation/acetate symporter
MGIVFFYAVIGGMKGITYTQVAQYCVLIFAFMVPAIFISIELTGNPIPQLGFGSDVVGTTIPLLDKLDGLMTELGFTAFTDGSKSTTDVFFITAALMVGTAGLPHVIVRFFTVPKVRDARVSAGYALAFIAILYTTAPAVAAFARTNLMDTVNDKAYKEIPQWFNTWEDAGLLAWSDKNNDGKIQYRPGDLFTEQQPIFLGARGSNGERIISNTLSSNQNELFIDKDIMVLANPEIARLPNWVVALVAAGGLAAALSTAAGLLLVISTSISHDLVKKQFLTDLSEKNELLIARASALLAVIVAGYFGINPPDFVAAVVALAFGLAAASFFPAIFLGIFYKRMNKEGAIAGMIAGLGITTFYMLRFKLGWIGEPTTSADWWFGISPEGFGTVGMLINFGIAFLVSRFTPAPPIEVQAMVEEIRIPIKGKE